MTKNGTSQSSEKIYTLLVYDSDVILICQRRNELVNKWC